MKNSHKRHRPRCTRTTWKAVKAWQLRLVCQSSLESDEFFLLRISPSSIQFELNCFYWTWLTEVMSLCYCLFGLFGATRTSSVLDMFPSVYMFLVSDKIQTHSIAYYLLSDSQSLIEIVCQPLILMQIKNQCYLYALTSISNFSWIVTDIQWYLRSFIPVHTCTALFWSSLMQPPEQLKFCTRTRWPWRGV